MKRRVRTVFLGLFACAALACLALLLWLPWNPLEADAGSLDEWIPDDVDALVRFDAGELRRAKVVHALWEGPAGRRLREEFDLDAGIEEALRVESRLAELPLLGAEPPTIERDLFGGEVIVVLRGDDLLVLSRITGRAKALDLLRRLGNERCAAWGVCIDGDDYAVADAEGTRAWFGRRRDVFLVSTSKELIHASTGLAAGRGTSIASRPDYRNAVFGPNRVAKGEVGMWIRGQVVRPLVGKPPVAASFVAPAFGAPITGLASVGSGAGASIALAVEFAAGRADASMGAVSRVAATAERLAIPGRAFAVGALPITAREAVAVLFESQPPARRRLVDDLLASQGSSVDAIVDDLSGHLDDGVGFVVARLPEVDSLRLDHPDGDPVEPIPATLVAFHVASGGPDAFLADLRRHAAALFGDGVEMKEAAGPAGARLFRPVEAESLGPEWTLFRPVVAVVGDDIVFCTNERYLAEALATPHERSQERAIARLRIDAAVLHKALLDRRWDVADRATYHDWVAERAAFRRELERGGDALPPGARDRREDAEIARRTANRKQREFPAAIARHAESLSWLESFTDAEFQSGGGGRSLQVQAQIGVRQP